MLGELLCPSCKGSAFYVLFTGDTMKRGLFLCRLAVLLLALTACCAWPLWAGAAPNEAKPTTSQAAHAKALLRYPGVKAVKENKVTFADGSSLPFNDGKVKSLAEKLSDADIEDHFTQAYPAFAPIDPPALNFDPGRFRNDQFFKKLYGGTKSEVEANLTEVNWLPTHGGKKLLFNKRQNAAAQLQKVSNELDKLPAQFMKYLLNIDSTFQYRPIQGTKRLSPHSYGIAIDLETKYTCYWLWDKTYHYRNQIPPEIVAVFEKHGFIWGGRWYHYDTMHFEYRPEMFTRVQ
jgi:hypothetical protein